MQKIVYVSLSDCTITIRFAIVAWNTQSVSKATINEEEMKTTVNDGK